MFKRDTYQVITTLKNGNATTCTVRCTFRGLQKFLYSISRDGLLVARDDSEGVVYPPSQIRRVSFLNTTGTLRRDSKDGEFPRLEEGVEPPEEDEEDAA